MFGLLIYLCHVDKRQLTCSDNGKSIVKWQGFTTSKNWKVGNTIFGVTEENTYNSDFDIDYKSIFNFIYFSEDKGHG